MTFEWRSEVPASGRELFDWHARLGAFHRLAPPWQSMEVLQQDAGLKEGHKVELKIGTPLGKRRWLARHASCIDGQEFTDTQEKGPFKAWTHRHVFTPLGENRSELRDCIDFETPLGGIGRRYVEKQLVKTFSYRHWITRRDLALKAALPHFRLLKVAIAGGSGFLGTNLKALLEAQGHEVKVLTRSKSSPCDIQWNPQREEIELPLLEGLDAVVNLAGENLTSGRWSDERKRRLWSSRVDSTAFLAESFSRLKRPPGVFLSGSGIGIYGSDPELRFAESASAGKGFLADLCQVWEEAAVRAENLGTRVCLLRTGVVLDPRGGALQKMLPAFRMGLGGPLGDGQQWFPWVSLEDWLGGVNWLLFAKKARGPANLVAPEAAPQREFARVLGKTLARPASLPAPRWVLELALGQMAEEALLSSIRAEPVLLKRLGYSFVLPRLEDALGKVL